MKKIIFMLLLPVVLSACGTVQFDPAIHQLAETAIPNFDVSGNVSITNNQTSSDPVIIHSYGGTKYESDYKTITETMVKQAENELARHATNKKSGSDKTIKLKVTHLNSKYIAFYWKGTMTYTVDLGNGSSFEKTIKHGTGAGAAQDLSGSIADGVVNLFKDERVISYLSE